MQPFQLYGAEEGTKMTVAFFNISMVTSLSASFLLVALTSASGSVNVCKVQPCPWFPKAGSLSSVR